MKFLARVQNPLHEEDITYFGVVHQKCSAAGFLYHFCSSGYRMNTPEGLRYTLDAFLDHGSLDDQEMLCHDALLDSWITVEDEGWNVTLLIPLEIVTGEGYD